MSDLKELKAFCEKISKVHSTTVARIKDMDDRPTIEVIPSGSYSIDDALGAGGLPRGRVIEIFGPESGGKTTLCLLAIASCQRAGGTALFLDVENALSLDWAAKLGVDVDNLVFNQPDGGEQALRIVRDAVNSNLFDMIVVDSVAALVPQAEIDGEIGDQTMALQARMLGPAIRLLVNENAKTRTVLIFINQLRDTMAMYGPKETTPGGRALKFYSSVRLGVSKVGGSEIKAKKSDGDEGISGEVLGHTVKVKVVKNKVGRPMSEATFELRFTSGIDHFKELVDIGLARDVIKQSGPTYSFGTLKAVGREKFEAELKPNEKLQKEIWDAVLALKKV
ncbi:MAG: recombinase RecA [bacterium]